MQADPPLQAVQTQEFQLKELELLARQRQQSIEFQAQQQANIQKTFDIMFGQTRQAAKMFYMSFCLGFGLVIGSVIIYLFWPTNLITIAFFGVGALTMLSFFLRDPAERIQRTGGKLIQMQAAMRNHLHEISYWDTYFNQKLAASDPVKHEELVIALQSMRLGTQTIMRQIDESLDDEVSTSVETEDLTKAKLSTKAATPDANDAEQPCDLTPPGG